MALAFKRKADVVEDQIRQGILYGDLRTEDRLAWKTWRLGWGSP
jgi:hypothetical protein